ncbi:transcriptional regulator [Allochromatium palmeri]|uniref:Transcriptional regulator n=1 Tax=Allochromatium palmeri TaxID=231048 RepID=A0A6N8EJD8_9GAMM|nr:transcriptional regulator [Allochromatium palmeri]MTW23049.1 transcriptional regulator [Allochromatium palmeri]
MTTLTIGVSDLESIKARLDAAFRGEPQGCRYAFSSEERLLTVLNARRWAILKALAGAGPLGMRELGRDIKGVHNDSKPLVECGLIEKLPDGKVQFPYDSIDLELSFRHAA